MTETPRTQAELNMASALSLLQRCAEKGKCKILLGKTAPALDICRAQGWLAWSRDKIEGKRPKVAHHDSGDKRGPAPTIHSIYILTSKGREKLESLNA